MCVRVCVLGGGGEVVFLNYDDVYMYNFIFSRALFVRLSGIINFPLR